MIGINTEFWWFNVFGNFVMFMFLFSIFTYFIMSVIEKFSKKENKYKDILKVFIIIQFAFFVLSALVANKVLSHKMYLIITTASMSIYILSNFAYYIWVEKKIKEITKK